MHDAAVAARLVQRDVVLLLEHGHRRVGPELRQATRDGEPEDAGADDSNALARHSLTVMDRERVRMPAAARRRWGSPSPTVRLLLGGYRARAVARRRVVVFAFAFDFVSERPAPFATSPVGSFGSPACLRSLAAISAISSGA